MEGAFIKLSLPLYRHFNGGRAGILLSILLSKHYYHERTNIEYDGWFLQKTMYLAEQVGVHKNKILIDKEHLVENNFIKCMPSYKRGFLLYKINVQRVNSIITKIQYRHCESVVNQNFTMKRTKWSSKRNKNGKLLKLNSCEALQHCESVNKSNFSIDTVRVSTYYIFYIIKEERKYIFLPEICVLKNAQHIEKIILFFNSLEGTSNHKIVQGSKLLVRITKYLTNLLSGLPIENTKDKKPPLRLQRFFNSHKIPESLQTKKWTIDEILEVLPKAVELAKPYTKSKISLPDLLYNFNAGYSTFLKAAMTESSGDLRIQTLAKRMVLDLGDDKTPLPIAEKEITPLVELHTLKTVRALFSWALGHQGGEYIPTMYRVSDFVRKYQKFEAARKRADGHYEKKSSINKKKQYKPDITINNEDGDALEILLQQKGK